MADAYAEKHCEEWRERGCEQMSNVAEIEKE